MGVAAALRLESSRMEATALEVEPAALAASRQPPAPLRPLAPLQPKLQRRTRFGALGGALLLEGLVAAALIIGLTPKLARIDSKALQVSIVAPPAPKQELRREPREQFKPTLNQPIQPIVVPPLVNLHIETDVAPAPVAAPRPIHTPPPAAPEPKAEESFEARILRAVQAAVDSHYPAAARMLHQRGQVQVSFDYLDGAVSNVRLVQSSGLRLLDAAALATVRDTRFPAPPPKLVHQTMNYALWVRFRLAGED